MEGPLLWTFIANSDQVNKALHQKVSWSVKQKICYSPSWLWKSRIWKKNRDCPDVRFFRIRHTNQIYSSDFHLFPSREYFIKIAEHSETKSFKVFSKKTSNCFKYRIKTAPSRWAAVVGNEEDYIFDKYLNKINLHLFFYHFR